MAGDRGLAFVVVGMISISVLWVSNHRGGAHRAPSIEAVAPAAVQTSPAAAPNPAPEVIPMRAFARASDAGRFRDQVSGVSPIGTYPELTGSGAESLRRIRPRLRLAEEFDVQPAP